MNKELLEFVENILEIVHKPDKWPLEPRDQARFIHYVCRRAKHFSEQDWYKNAKRIT